jgi:hypothetical protein
VNEGDDEPRLVFHWRPRGVTEEHVQVTIVHNAEYSGSAVLVVPRELLDALWIHRRGAKVHGSLPARRVPVYSSVELRMPVRALAEFGLRAARDRIEGVLSELIDVTHDAEVQRALTKLTFDLDETHVES